MGYEPRPGPSNPTATTGHDVNVHRAPSARSFQTQRTTNESAAIYHRSLGVCALVPSRGALQALSRRIRLWLSLSTPARPRHTIRSLHHPPFIPLRITHQSCGVHIIASYKPRAITTAHALKAPPTNHSNFSNITAPCPALVVWVLVCLERRASSRLPGPA